jgi:MoaA/NifB/PqqE/SkfB family radical SAM enzyme
MTVYLTNIGHKYITLLLQSALYNSYSESKDTNLLKTILNKTLIEVQESEVISHLIEKRYVQLNTKNLCAEEVRLLYLRNPLQHVRTISLEYTTNCNFNCVHCRNLKSNLKNDVNLSALKSSCDLFIELGIRKFAFIGGEVSKYGNHWLELSKYINRDNSFRLLIVTNGWWLEETNFSAAGINYATDMEYLSDLKQNGLTHIIFSIDGDEKQHDKWRKHPGLFSKIMKGLSKVKKAGLIPGISVVFKDTPNQQFYKTLIKISEIIYSITGTTDDKIKLNMLSSDENNLFSNFIDIGNGVNIRTPKHKISNLPLLDLRCKAFYRPSPNLRINANGELSVCPILNAGEGYGNINDSKIEDLLNNMQESFVYRLHSEKLINNYLKYWNSEVFGKYYEHICSVRTVLTVLAKKMNSAGYDSSTEKNAISHLIDETSAECGFKAN